MGYVDNFSDPIALGRVRMEGDAVYFRRRAQEERRAAARAEHDTAHRLHLELADRYDQLASAIEPPELLPDVRATA